MLHAQLVKEITSYSSSHQQPSGDYSTVRQMMDGIAPSTCNLFFSLFPNGLPQRRPVESSAKGTQFIDEYISSVSVAIAEIANNGRWYGAGPQSTTHK